MSDGEDDYLSDKFLLQSTTSTSSKPSTYSQLRKQAQKKSHLKNEQNKTKNRKQLELESREEGLSKSLFERAKEDEAAGIQSGNKKALSIMAKMGFKPGQSLGAGGATAGNDDHQPPTVARSETPAILPDAAASNSELELPSTSHTKHKTEPLPLQEWVGRKGIGLGKRARGPSPSAAERLQKMVKMEEDGGRRDFRERARDDYNNRRSEGRLVPAQSTCRTLDEQIERAFNVLWLNPNDNNTFPPGLIDALALHSNFAPKTSQDNEEKYQYSSVQSRLKRQMQADALQPMANAEDDQDELAQGSLLKVSSSSKPPSEPLSTVAAPEDQFSRDILEEATQFLRLQAQDRLKLVLSYLRDKHAYCFWCGVEFASSDEMASQCPGPEEDDHD